MIPKLTRTQPIHLAPIACFSSSLLNAQVTLTQNFEGSTAGSNDPPPGWAFVNKTGSPSYMTSPSAQGGNGTGGSAGLAGQVSSTAFVDANLPGGYLVSNAALPLTLPVYGTFDFRIVHEGDFDDVVFMLGNVASGFTKTLGTGVADELLSVKFAKTSAVGIVNSVSNGFGRDRTVENDRLGEVITNNFLLLDDTWYRATVTWVPSIGTTGSFSIVVSDFTSDKFTLTVPSFTLGSANGYLGFGSVNDSIRFDNVNFSNVMPPGTASVESIISLNQIGYQSIAPKRFSAPRAADGQTFHITSQAAPSTVLFQGTIANKLGDFSAFQPPSPGPNVISYNAPGFLPVSSYPFLIQQNLIEEKMVKPAIDFMVDARSCIGTHPSAFGDAPWRDGTYYPFEIPSLIYPHLNARNASNQKTGQFNFASEKAVILNPSFPYINEGNAENSLGEIRNYYTNFEAPLPCCPDGLAVVHFGLELTMSKPDGNYDWSDDPLPKHIHSQTREWFAWFLSAWPSLRSHFPNSFYAACRDFTFANWSASSGLADSDLSNNRPSPLDIDPLWSLTSYGGHDKHPFKSRHAPGHPILPNLLLWQVALREGRSDAGTYLAAAQAQTQWIIDNLDWNAPRTTKGHRMSEHKMMPGLVHFLRNHSAEAPSGLAAKIEQWADVMIARSGNLSDFRRYELTDTDNDGVVDWTLPRQPPNWN